MKALFDPTSEGKLDFDNTCIELMTEDDLIAKFKGLELPISEEDYKIFA